LFNIALEYLERAIIMLIIKQTLREGESSQNRIPFLLTLSIIISLSKYRDD